MKKKIVPVVPTEFENGNTDSNSDDGSINAKFLWDFTHNNYTEDDVCQWKNFILENCKKGGFGFEIAPETGTPHLQGYISLKIKVRKNNLTKLFPRASFRPVRNETALINYIQKTGNSWSHNIKKFTVEIEKFYDWELEIIETLKNEPDKRKIFWYHEPLGNRGKTTFQKYIFTHYEGVIVVSGKAADMKNCVIEYYKTKKYFPRIILVNIPRSSSKFISYTGLEEIKDMFFYSGKYEGGMVCGENPHMFIFANCEPEYELMSPDKWNVIEIK